MDSFVKSVSESCHFSVCISPQYLAERQYCKTILMEKLISKYFPSEFKERQKIHLEEMAEFSK